MKSNNSAHSHRKAGVRPRRPRREPPMDAKLIDFLEARGLYHLGKQGIDFKARKNLDQRNAA